MGNRLSQVTIQMQNVLFTGFNQDFTCLGFGTTFGFTIHDTYSLALRFNRRFENGGIKLFEMLFRTNIIAFVGDGRNPQYSRNKVMIWDDAVSSCIAELTFSSPVKGIRLRRDKIMIILEKKVYIYSFPELAHIWSVETFSNPSGIGVMNASQDSSVIACLGSKIGQVILHSQDHSLVIDAHKHAVAQISLSLDGQLLATASVQGTLIRVFETTTGRQVNKFRCGSVEAKIQSISFNQSGTSLVVSSNHGTVHICSLEEETIRQFEIPETSSLVCFGQNGEVIAIGRSGTYYRYVYDPASTDYRQESMVRFI